MSSNEIDELINDINYIYIDNNVETTSNRDLIHYIKSLNLHQNIKKTLISLIHNDSYQCYIDIYNICLENNIELPPLN